MKMQRDAVRASRLATLLVLLPWIAAGPSLAQTIRPVEGGSEVEAGPGGSQSESGSPSAGEQGAGAEPGAGGEQTEPQRPDDERDPHKPDMRDLNPMERDPQTEELIKLFGEVERRLEAIDLLLTDASAGQTSKLSEVGESGIDELLRNAPENPRGGGAGQGDASSSGEGSSSGVGGMLERSANEGQAVLRAIDRIIEIAQSQQQQQGQGGGQQQQPQNGEDPLDGQQNNRTEKTKSPEGPQEQPEGQQENEQEGGQQPKGPEESRGKPDQKPSNQSPDDETEDPSAADDSYRNWGELPIHYRDIFRAEGGKDMPAEYRDWIDAYYRRLNTRSGG